MINHMDGLKDLSKEELIDLARFLKVVFAACQIFHVPLDLLLEATVGNNHLLQEIAEKGQAAMTKVNKITAKRKSELN